MKILNIIQENKTVNITVNLAGQIFTVFFPVEKVVNNPNYIIHYFEKMKRCKKITEKVRKENLEKIQKCPIFSIVAINPYTGNEYRIK